LKIKLTLFSIREKSTGKVTDIDMPSGTLAWMSGDFQREFNHEIPKEATRNGRRVSLTFRRHVK